MTTEANNSIKQNIQEFSFSPRVLVVDDEQRIQRACHRLLTEEGCEVHMAEDGIKGLGMIEDKHFDIILLDLMMPGISGMEVLSKVKASRPDTVVIVVTGYATIEHSIDAMKKGAFDFLPKPFSPGELRLVIGKAMEFLQTLQDIATEKSRMRVMINTLSDGVLTTDSQKRIALANPAFLRAIGSNKTSAIGLNVTDLIEDETLLEMIDLAIHQPSDIFEEITREITLPSRDGKSEVILGIRSIPFRDRLNRNLGSVTVFNDITASKQKDQSKSDFVSMVAHEINSPLNSVLMQLDVVLDGLAGDLTEKQADILTRISGRVKSLSALSSELLDLSKIESGLINQVRQELDLLDLVKDLVIAYQEPAKAKSITLSFENGTGPVSIMGNKINIEEVVSNLISNAIRYTPDNGQIKVGLKDSKERAKIWVADTGLGIPESDMDQIFERFFRVRNEKTRYINGTGLGLAIVKRIVDAHHGTIDVQSKEDEGTTFTVNLPKFEYTV